MDLLMKPVSSVSANRKSARSAGVASKFILIALVLVLSACQPVEPLKNSSEYQNKPGVKYCVYRYYVGDEKVQIPVCSQYPLSKRQQVFLDDQFDYSCYLYRRFASRYGLKVPGSSKLELDIYLTTYDHINNLDYFPRQDKDLKIVGRYINDRADIFITERTFTSEGFTDAPHEYAHWFNDMMGIRDKKRNEKLAREFERYYEAETR